MPEKRDLAKDLETIMGAVTENLGRLRVTWVCDHDVISIVTEEADKPPAFGKWKWIADFGERKDAEAFAAAYESAPAAIRRALAAEAEVERLKTALEFYAGTGQYQYGQWAGACNGDGGAKARAALKGGDPT